MKREHSDRGCIDILNAFYNIKSDAEYLEGDVKKSIIYYNRSGEMAVVLRVKEDCSQLWSDKAEDAKSELERLV